MSVEKTCALNDIPEVFEEIQNQNPTEGPEYIASMLIDRLAKDFQKKLEPKDYDPSLMMGVLAFKNEISHILEDEGQNQESPSYFLLENINAGLDGMARIVINGKVGVPTELNGLLMQDQSTWTPRQIGQLVKEIIQYRVDLYDDKPSDQRVVEKMEKTIPMVLRAARDMNADNYDRLADIGKNITKHMRRKALDELSALDQEMGRYR